MKYLSVFFRNHGQIERLFDRRLEAEVMFEGSNVILKWVIRDILDTILTEEFVKSLMIVLMLDFSEPWRFQASLNEWLDLVTGKISQMKIGLKNQDEMRAKSNSPVHHSHIFF